MCIRDSVWAAPPGLPQGLFFISNNTTQNRITSEGGRTSGTEGVVFRRLDGDTTSIQVFGSITANVPVVKLVSANYTAQTTLSSVNGISYTGTPSTTPGNTSATNSGSITLGSLGTASFFNGRLMAAIAIRAALNQQEIDRLSGILAWMTKSAYVLSASHPYANSPPLIGG